MKEILLFTDGSVDTKSNIGYGAYLFVSDFNSELETLKTQVKIHCFNDTSSTKLELQILLRALTDIELKNCRLNVYTDSQNILSLPDRRQKFEEKDYLTAKNKTIRNHLLYKEFFKTIDRLDVKFFKIKGHKASRDKTEIEQLFTLVDRASRNALRASKQ